MTVLAQWIVCGLSAIVRQNDNERSEASRVAARGKRFVNEGTERGKPYIHVKK